MYTDKNYRTKKELITDFKVGKKIRVYQPGGIFPGQTDGEVVIEMPHYPEPHRSYAQATIQDGIIIRVK